jgi:uncharacterized membrane protein
MASVLPSEITNKSFEVRQNDDKLFTERNHLNFKIVQKTAKNDEFHTKHLEEEKHEVNSKNFSSERESSEEGRNNPENEIEIETKKIKYNG